MWELSNIDASGLVGPWYHDLRRFGIMPLRFVFMESMVSWLYG